MWLTRWKLKEEHDLNEIADLLDEVQRSLGSIRATLTGAEEGPVGEDEPDEVAVVEPRRWRFGVFLVDVFVQFLAKFLALRTLAWMDRRAATAVVSAVTAKAATTATVVVTATTTRTTIATITETAVVLMVSHLIDIVFSH